MRLLEPQHLLNLPIAQRRLPLPHLPRNRAIRRKLVQELARRKRRRDAVVGRVEHLKPQPVFPHAQIAYLAQIPRVDITPRIPLAHGGILDVRGEIPRVLVRLDDIAYAQRVDVRIEAAREAACDSLAAEFANRIRVHGIDVVGFVEREGRIIQIALAEADFVGGFGGGDDDFADAEFAGGFDDVVGACCVASVALVVLRAGQKRSSSGHGGTHRHQHVARVRGEVDDGVGRAGVVRALVVFEAVVGGQRVEDLAAVGQVRFEGEDAGGRVGKVGQVDVEDLVALGEEVRDDMSSCFAGAAGEDDAFSCTCHYGGV